MKPTEVEVLSPETRGWYPCRIIDFNASSFCVRYPSNWEDEWVPFRQVHAQPDKGEFKDFAVGTQVEVLCNDNGHVAWFPGVVKLARPSLKSYVIHYEGEGFAQDDIKEVEELRPVSATGYPNPSMFSRAEIAVAAALRDWAMSDRCRPVLDDAVAKLDNLHEINFVPETSRFVLLGSAIAVSAAKNVLEFTLSRQLEAERLGRHQEERRRTIQDMERRIHHGVRAEFSIPADLVGFVIGKGGQNVKQIQKELNVTIRTFSAGERDSQGHVIPEGQALVCMMGDTQEQLQLAREKLEYVEEQYTVDRGMIGWVLGKKGRNINDIQTKAGVMRMYVDNEGCISIVGLKANVVAACLLLDSALKYFSVCEELEKESESLNSQYLQLGFRGESGRGRGGFKGRGRGRGGYTGPPRSSEQQQENGTVRAVRYLSADVAPVVHDSATSSIPDSRSNQSRGNRHNADRAAPAPKQPHESIPGSSPSAVPVTDARAPQNRRKRVVNEPAAESAKEEEAPQRSSRPVQKLNQNVTVVYSQDSQGPEPAHAAANGYERNGNGNGSKRDGRRAQGGRRNEKEAVPIRPVESSVGSHPEPHIKGTSKGPQRQPVHTSPTPAVAPPPAAAAVVLAPEQVPSHVLPAQDGTAPVASKPRTQKHPRKPKAVAADVAAAPSDSSGPVATPVPAQQPPKAGRKPQGPRTNKTQADGAEGTSQWVMKPTQ
eukprot:GILK01002372.1.p1 GENE.GILK01002372.1~~GILK01002372.1.p1  ORF type:complete len:713 (+),score=120.24 GILK01002372.1:85-2223(+)